MRSWTWSPAAWGFPRTAPAGFVMVEWCPGMSPRSSFSPSLHLSLVIVSKIKAKKLHQEAALEMLTVSSRKKILKWANWTAQIQAVCRVRPLGLFHSLLEVVTWHSDPSHSTLLAYYDISLTIQITRDYWVPTVCQLHTPRTTNKWCSQAWGRPCQCLHPQAHSVSHWAWSLQQNHCVLGQISTASALTILQAGLPLFRFQVGPASLEWCFHRNVIVSHCFSQRENHPWKGNSKDSFGFINPI